MMTQITARILDMLKERLMERNEKGFLTYGETLDDVPFANYDWEKMFIEELLDGVQYLMKENEHLKQMLKDVEREKQQWIEKNHTRTRFIVTGEEEQKVNFKVFDEDVWRTFNQELDVKDSITNAIFGLTGEAGEVADIFKKVWYQGHNEGRQKIIKELGDVMYYVSLLAMLMDSSLEEVVTQNILKRGERYPKGFSKEASVNRKDELKELW